MNQFGSSVGRKRAAQEKWRSPPACEVVCQLTSLEIAARERHEVVYSETCRQNQRRAFLFRPGDHPRPSADGQPALLPGLDAVQADRPELEGPAGGLAQFQGG